MKDNNLFSIIPYKGELIELYSAKVARAYYLNYAIDLLTGKKIAVSLAEWQKNLSAIKLSTPFRHTRMIHLFYELGHVISKENSLFSEDTLLAIDIEFEKIKKAQAPAKSNDLGVQLVKAPSYKDYQQAFLKGRDELLKGNCYQFNLSCPYVYRFNKNARPRDFIHSLWNSVDKRGAFGSATFIPYFQELFLSNSPECLFQLKNGVLSSLPIKGTMKCAEGESWQAQYKKLVRDKKNQAELFMIADLVRNDLSRIEFPKAKIVHERLPQLAPGLIHQCAQIDVELSSDVHLWQIIQKIFPGGSVTGAPKERVMKILAALEKRERGFYCGSTIMLHRTMKSASINIRSGVFDFKNSTLHYQAGGGITLLSSCEAEFEEMTYKHDSFVKALTL